MHEWLEPGPFSSSSSDLGPRLTLYVRDSVSAQTQCGVKLHFDLPTQCTTRNCMGTVHVVVCVQVCA